MKKRETAKIANSDLLDGSSLYLERARLALPYLVRQAKAGQTIYYSDLSQEIQMPNPRNLNYVLGAIGNALIALGKRSKTKIPPIQCVVINKRDHLPGEGIGWFISPKEFGKLTKPQRKFLVDAELAKIYTYQYWDWVLEEFNLQPIEEDLSEELKGAKGGFGGGETEAHRKFKNFIAANPWVLGITSRITKVETEYPLPSGDKIDVLFTCNNLKIGVEVKSIISIEPDILRGVFQCVKYKHLIEAEQTVSNELPNSRVILALQGKFPKNLNIAKNLLGVEVVDRIKISS